MVDGFIESLLLLFSTLTIAKTLIFIPFKSHKKVKMFPRKINLYQKTSKSTYIYPKTKQGFDLLRLTTIRAQLIFTKIG